MNSPFRGFHHVDPSKTPRIIARGDGAFMIDVDGNRYLDFLGAWGPLVLGHRHPEVTAAITQALADGWVFGTSTEIEQQMAEAVRQALPSMEMVRFVNSGAEAVQACVRLARAASRREVIVKLEGGYHGHVESLDMADPLDRPNAALSGSVKALVDRTLTVPFGDASALEVLLAERARDIAAVIVEPVPGSMGVIVPHEGYLRALREITRKHDVLLIFDEVLTGFRVAYGGAQQIWGVDPDITALGKAVGGGLPCGAYGGKRAVMERVAPVGPMYQAGTFSGNPLSMRAGLATLEVLRRPGTYERLGALTRRLCDGFERVAAAHGVAMRAPSVGGMFGMLFTAQPVRNLDDFKRCDDPAFARFFFAMLDQGFYFPPSQSDAAAVSTAHTEADIDATIEAASRALATAVAAR